jgi:hypothetical protein
MLAGLFQVRNVIFRHLPLRCPAHGRITYSEPRLAMVVVCSAAGALPNRVPLWGDGRHTSVEPFISQRLYKIAHSGQKVVWQKFTLSAIARPNARFRGTAERQLGTSRGR